MLGLSSKKERQYLLFDIGSASVGVAVAVHTDKSLELLWTKRLEYGYQSNDDYNRYVRTMYATLLEAGMKLTSEGLREASALAPNFSVRQAEVYCLLAPPWVMSSVLFQSENKEKPFQVSQETISSLQQKGLSEVYKKQEVMSWQELMGTPAMLEAYHDVIRLEGYQVQSFEHKTVHDFSTQSYFSIISESVQSHIKEVLERVVPNHHIHFSSSARIFSTSLEKHSSLRRSVFLEISGEVTSVGMVQQGVLTAISTVALGTNHILKSIAPKALSAKEARSSLDVFHTKTKSENTLESFPEPVREALLKWQSAIIKSIRLIAGGVTPPADIQVLVDDTWFPLYKTALEQTTSKAQNATGVRVQRLYEKLFQKNADTQVQDKRMEVFARVLDSCTSKNTMCYTKGTI